MPTNLQKYHEPPLPYPRGNITGFLYFLSRTGLGVDLARNEITDFFAI